MTPVFHDDPTDAELASSQRALCVLSPSHYEGYGLPLLEAMATGTPFLSSDTGAARDLAVDDGQVLELSEDAWLAQLRAWTGTDLSDIRQRGAERRELRPGRTAPPYSMRSSTPPPELADGRGLVAWARRHVS